MPIHTLYMIIAIMPISKPMLNIAQRLKCIGNLLNGLHKLSTSDMHIN